MLEYIEKQCIGNPTCDINFDFGVNYTLTNERPDWEKCRNGYAQFFV